MNFRKITYLSLSMLIISTTGYLHAMEPFACKVPTSTVVATHPQTPEDREFAAQRETKRRQADENARPQLNIPQSGLPKEEQRLADGLAILFQLRGIQTGPGLPQGLKNLVCQYCPQLRLTHKLPIPRAAKDHAELFTGKDNQETRRFKQLLEDKVHLSLDNHGLDRLEKRFANGSFKTLANTKLTYVADEHNAYMIEILEFLNRDIRVCRSATDDQLHYPIDPIGRIVRLRHNREVQTIAIHAVTDQEWYVISAEKAGPDYVKDKSIIYIWKITGGKNIEATLVRKLTDCGTGITTQLATYGDNNQDWYIVAYSTHSTMKIWHGATGNLVCTHLLKPEDGNIQFGIYGIASQKSYGDSWNIIIFGIGELQIRDALTFKLLDSFEIDIHKTEETLRNMAAFQCRDGRFLIVTRSNDCFRIFNYGGNSISDVYAEAIKDKELAQQDPSWCVIQ